MSGVPPVLEPPIDLADGGDMPTPALHSKKPGLSPRMLMLCIGIPSAVVVLTIILVAGVSAFRMLTSPDVSNPQQHRSSSLSFDYPGNWSIDMNDPDYDPNGDLFIEAPLASALVHVTTFWSDDRPENELQLSVENVWALLASASESEGFTQWGRHTGQGRTLLGRMDGREVIVRIFVAQMPNDQILKVNETCPVSASEAVEPGFKLIQSTLALR